MYNPEEVKKMIESFWVSRPYIKSFSLDDLQKYAESCGHHNISRSTLKRWLNDMGFVAVNHRTWVRRDER